MKHAPTPVLAALFALAFCLPAVAQPSPEAEQAMDGIRPHAIRAHMRFLADDLLEGRDTASRGYDLAARYVASVFETLGLAPAGTGNSYLQPVPMLRINVVESKSSMSLSRNGRKTRLQYGKDYISDYVAEADSSVTAPVVFVGFGITAPELNHDDYAGVDARGKITAFLTGAPASFPQPQKTLYSDRRGQIRNALAHGAVGVLIIPTPEVQKMFSMESLLRYTRTPTLVWADDKGRPGTRQPELRAAAFLGPTGIAKLFTGSPCAIEDVFKTAAESGRPQSFDLPVQASLRTVNRSERAASPNVAAVLRGSDPKLREEYVVVTAHLDHIGVGEPTAADAIYNGAYDNASGVAILLEMANAFTRLPAPPRRSVLFLAITGEEKGLHGSDYFLRHPTVPGGGIVANVNLDMFLMLYPLKDVIAYGAEHSSLGPVLEKAAGQLGISVSPDPHPEQNVFLRSDHYAFVQQGIPAIYLSAGIQTSDPAIDAKAAWERWLREVYHQPGDDMSQPMDFGSGAQFAKLNFLLTWLIAQEDQAPVWNPGDFFGGKFGKVREKN